MEKLRSTLFFLVLVLALVAASAIMDESRRGGESVHDKCGKSSIHINQSPSAPLPSGIPQYTVEIVNKCVSGCKISNIHVACGMFSSARLINPKIFKRLCYNDCLVNDGKRLRNGGIISFKYASTYAFHLSVSSVVCG